jgi:hypothetical protein
MILGDLLRPLTREVTIHAFEKEKRIRSKYGNGFVARPPAPVQNGTPNGKNKPAAVTEVKDRIMWVKVPGKDIYGNEKSTDIRYFKCTNCGRNIAGTRFAAHIERCLSGRNSRARPKYNGEVSSSASPPESDRTSSSRASPAKRTVSDMNDGNPKSQISKFLDRSKRVRSSSLPPSRTHASDIPDRTMSETPGPK